MMGGIGVLRLADVSLITSAEVYYLSELGCGHQSF